MREMGCGSAVPALATSDVSASPSIPPTPKCLSGYKAVTETDGWEQRRNTSLTLKSHLWAVSHVLVQCVNTSQAGPLVTG